jgi:hypothetical protein
MIIYIYAFVGSFNIFLNFNKHFSREKKKKKVLKRQGTKINLTFFSYLGHQKNLKKKKKKSGKVTLLLTKIVKNTIFFYLNY